ncbi:MAG: 30S ribosome-binding factor RbfA [Patescibacteria group bacterium]|nr:30S ribosome-binding factor RbfA [Patescibacteria group bacterium]
MSKRTEKVSELMKRQLSEIIFREIDFPRNVLVTLTRVKVSDDLSSANIYMGTLPEKESQKILKILNFKIYSIQKEIDKRLRMRPIPKIRFLEEKETKKAAIIEQVLEKIQKENKGDD